MRVPDVRARIGAFALLTTLGLFACEATPPVVNVAVEVGATSPPVDDLLRLRLVVRRCDDNLLGSAQDLVLSGGGMPPLRDLEADAAVVPGDPFYVWLQAWGRCAEDRCNADETSPDSACRCFGEFDPPFQLLVAEACTGFMVVDGDDIDVALTLEGTSNRCPPPRPASCDDVRP